MPHGASRARTLRRSERGLLFRHGRIDTRSVASLPGMFAPLLFRGDGPLADAPFGHRTKEIGGLGIHPPAANLRLQKKPGGKKKKTRHEKLRE